MAASRSSSPEPEIRRLCPACPGLPMKKLEIGTDPGRLTLDACGRCGGIWFDAGEVDRLRRLGVRAIETHVALTQEAYRKRCGSCDASYLRNADRCPACKAPNLLRCPSCAKLLEPARTGATKLDVCRNCRGVWFDSVELKEIWNTALVQRRGMRPTTALDVAANSMDTFLIASYLMPGPSIVAGGVASVGADAGSGLLDSAGNVASSVFDAIADLISGIFE